MTGFWILLLMIFITALPVLGAYLWFRSRQLPITTPWFLLAVLSGVPALLTAVFLQSRFPPANVVSLGSVLFKIIVQTALTEEFSRLLVLAVFLKIARHWGPSSDEYSPGYAAAAGLLAGLGFAVMENAFYGAADMGIALLRAFTAAPLHGACGGRAGLATIALTRRPGLALGHFLAALVIHSMYNFILVNPGTPSLLAALLAFTALISTIRAIKAQF